MVAPSLRCPAMTPTTPPHTRPRVLIVDDEAIVGCACARALRHHASVVVEQQPARAFERIQGGERFDVVLCDVMMPEMSGPELFDRVVACAPEMRSAFVFATGGNVAEWVERRLEATGRPCLQKPLSGDTIRSLLDTNCGE